MSRICFFAERHLGISSAAGAIEPYVRDSAHADWVDVTYAPPAGYRIPAVLPDRISGPLFGVLQTGAALRRGEYDAVGFLTHNPAVLQQQAIRHIPTLLWTDVTPAQLDERAADYQHRLDGRLVRALKHALVKRCFRRAALCVGWSEWALRSFVDDYGVDPSCTRVLAPGLDLSRWSLTGAKPISPKPRLLFVGGDFTRKGGDLLLDVFRSHFSDRAELDIVTRDQHVVSASGVRVHRNLDAGSIGLMDLYRSATAFVLPTRSDCYSIASLEAMAMQLPVVVTGVGGIPDIVEHGQTGWLVPPGDGTALCSAIDALLADPARAATMGGRGRARVAERFDARQTAHTLLSLLGVIARVPATRMAHEARAAS
jgi:glycosyltransferase involved in cell wall biosynthesis